MVLLDDRRNALPGIEGIQPPRRRRSPRSGGKGRNALPGIEGIQRNKIIREHWDDFIRES